MHHVAWTIAGWWVTPPLKGWIRTQGNGEYLCKDESGMMPQDVNVIPDVRFKHGANITNVQLAHHLVGAIK